MKFIEEMEVKNKKVLLRLDLNVTIQDNKILDDTKIKKSIPTIQYLLDHGAKVLILSHLGKIKTKEDKINNSLRIVCETLTSFLKQEVTFVPNTRGDKLEHILDTTNLAMMENTRFEDLPQKYESGCDLKLASYWASLGDIFINDAFGTTHRKHASNYGISKYIESGYGFLIKEELTGLKPIIEDIKHPFVVIMGGAKVDDKVALIKALLKECDALLVGGGIANTFIKASGHSIGESLYSESYIDEVKEILAEYKTKIHIPIDVCVENKENVKNSKVINIENEDIIYDIGAETIKAYEDIIKNAKTIFMNGTPGLYEKEQFRNGTIQLFELLKQSNAIKIAGGGDAVASANALGYNLDFHFLSTGGGATLEYIAEKHLKCFEEDRK